MTPSALIVPCGRALGLAWFTVNRSRRRIARRATWPRRFRSRSAAERRAIARAAFAHFIAQAFETLKFSTLSPQQMLARVEVDGEDRVRLAYGQGKGVLFITGHFGFWELHAIAHPLLFEPIGAAGPRPRQRPHEHAARADPPVHRQHGHLPPGFDSAGDADAAGEPRRRRADRSAHPRAGRRVRGVFRAPRGDGVSRGGAGASDGFARRAVFALPLGKGRYRLIYEHPVEPPAETERAPDVDPGIHAALHGRPRDVRAPPPGPVAVDASPLARRRSVGRRALISCRNSTFDAASISAALSTPVQPTSMI